MKVDVPTEIIDKIKENYQNPTSTLYLPAQKEIENDMENQLLENFLTSEEYTLYRNANDPSPSRPMSPML